MHANCDAEARLFGFVRSDLRRDPLKFHGGRFDNHFSTAFALAGLMSSASILIR
jgi:hypothetical protein